MFNRVKRVLWWGILQKVFLASCVLAIPLVFSFGSVHGIAKQSTLSMTISADALAFSITPTADGAFGKTFNNTISITTDNFTGYTLSVSSSTSTSMENSNHDAITTISSAIDESTFANGSADTYNNKWGYQANILNTSTSQYAPLMSGNYLPAPTTTATAINTTACANGSTSCPNSVDTYGIRLGARLDYTKPTGTYTNIPFRVLTFDSVDGAIASARFQGVSSLGADYRLYLFVFFPSSYGNVSHDSSIVTTVTQDAGNLPPITVNVDVDLGPVVSGLDGIAGQVAQAKDDVQGIATDISAIGSLLAVDEQLTQSVLYLDPIDTLPTLDYHQVIDDVDGVLDDIPAAVAGTASIWGIISAFFTSDSVWLWLVPLCIFLCLASFVLWRR